MGALGLLGLTLALSSSAAPLAEAWPYAAKRLPDGSVEYVYDLTAIKGAQGYADAREANGDLEVTAYLRALPREARVRVAPGATLDVTTGRGPEARPLATAFSLVSDGPFETENPLVRKGGPRLRPALHVDEPKLLVTAEMLASQVRVLEDGALAAAELDSEWLRKDVWSKVAERAAARFKVAQGDEREGSLALAARALAANACLDATRLPEPVKSEGELLLAASAEIEKLAAEPDIFSPPPPWSWSPELTCAWVRQRVLGLPLERSRAGTAAVVIFFDLLAKDAKLKGLDTRSRARRDHFLGTPAADPLKLWEAQVKGDPAHALESISEFIESLPITERLPPPLLALPSTPFLKFLSELTGPERVAAWDELASAVQDGRIVPGGAGWPQAREAELTPFVGVGREEHGVQFDAAWRDQLRSSFAVLQGGALEARAKNVLADPEPGDRSELVVRLMAPPLLEAEPVPEAFRAAARSLDALAEALTVENLQTLRAFTAEGRRGDVLLTEARRLAPRLRAMAVLATPDARGDSRELLEARRFVATWRSEPGLGRDVRAATAFFLSMGSARAHAVVVGVARRELIVGFATPPKVELVGGVQGFVIDATARQHYLVPVLRTVAATAPAGLKTLDRATVRTLVDGVGRELGKVDEVIIESLRQ